MLQRFLAVFVCAFSSDRHCDPANPWDTNVDPRFPCNIDGMGNFGNTTSNSSVTVEFQYQIETNTEAQVSFPATYQVELALSNVLANAFFECRRRRNLQPDMILESLQGISAFPVDRVYGEGTCVYRQWTTIAHDIHIVPCALESSAPGCFTLGGGFTIYGEGDLSWVETVAYTVTENAMNEGILNIASPEIQQVRYVADGAIVILPPTGAPTEALPTATPILRLPSPSPTTVPPSISPTTVAQNSLQMTSVPTILATTASPTTLAAPISSPITQSPSPTTTSPTTAPVVQSRETNAPAGINQSIVQSVSDPFPWWYIAAAGGTALLGISGASFLYARKRRQQESNDTTDLEPPSEPAVMA